MKRKIISILCIIGLWWIAAVLVNRTVILPLPYDVFKRMFTLATSSSFYASVVSTLGRIIIGFTIAMITGTILGVFSGLYRKIEDYLSIVISILQSIPQIAYILIILVWFKSFTAIIIIILLMVLPVFYNNVCSGIKNIDPELKDVILLYNQPFTYTLFKIYLPLIKSYILSAMYTSLPLSFKVGVMAEIFVQTNQGIGSALYFARTQIDMVSIFAWTIWMIIIVISITNGFSYIQKKTSN